MSPARRTAVGAGMLAAGLAMALAAALVAWSAVQRWTAVEETRDALALMRRERIADARALAAAAAARAPDEAAPALLAADPADDAAVDALERFAAGAARAADRAAAQAAIALARVARGRPAGIEVDAAADARLLQAMVAAAAGRDPGRLRAEAGEEAPHLSVLRAAHTVLLRRAWGAGRVSAARAHAGALLLLRPQAAEAPVLHLLVGAGSALLPDADAVRLAEAVKSDQEAVVRAVAALLPQRRAAFAARWPTAAEGPP